MCSEGIHAKFPLSASSAYLKTACMVMKELNYIDDNNYCISKGMALFKIENAMVQTAFYAVMNQMFGVGACLRIDGARDETGDNLWYSYSYGKTPIFTGLNWHPGTDFCTKCTSLVIYKHTQTSFTVEGTNPATAMWAICEFV